MALWGGTWPVGRVVAASIEAWNAALIRFVMATTVLVLICVRTGGRSALQVRPGLLPRLFVLGATGIFGYSLFFFSGLRTTAAGRAALIVGCIPVCIAMGSCLLGRRWPRLALVAGVLLSLAGVSVVIADGSPLRLFRGGVQRGDLLILCAVVCWTSYTLFARPVMKELSPLVAVTWSCIFGSILILPVAVFGGLWQDLLAAGRAEWWGLTYLGVAATSLGYFWYYKAIHHVGPVAAGIFINLVPLFAVFLGCTFLDEPLQGAHVAGGLMVISGVVVTVKSSQRKG